MRPHYVRAALKLVAVYSLLFIALTLFLIAIGWSLRRG